MNWKKTKFVAVLVVLTIGLFWWASLRPPSGPTLGTDVVADPPANAATKRAIEEPKPKVITELRTIVEEANRPISFWGKVIDQYRAPIGGVSVVVSIRHAVEIAPGAVRDDFDTLTLSTDAAGLFHVTGRRGSLLGIEGLKKEGYEAPYLRNRSYWYARASSATVFEPDETKPEIFELWKKQGAERLVVGDKFYGIVPDGRAYAIDLIEGRKLEGSGVGDFTIAISRPNNVAGMPKYDWRARIGGIGGGVVETRDEFMYLAPEAGYADHYEIVVNASDAQWADRVKSRFYLKSNDGKVYARLELELFANYQDNAVASIRYFANVAGSRNLEYDPLQEVTPPSP